MCVKLGVNLNQFPQILRVYKGFIRLIPIFTLMRIVNTFGIFVFASFFTLGFSRVCK
jgi:hypothetical protein